MSLPATSRNGFRADLVGAPSSPVAVCRDGSNCVGAMTLAEQRGRPRFRIVWYFRAKEEGAIHSPAPTPRRLAGTLLSSGYSGQRSEPWICAASISGTGSACIAPSRSAGRGRPSSWRARPGSTNATRYRGVLWFLGGRSELRWGDGSVLLSAWWLGAGGWVSGACASGLGVAESRWCVDRWGRSGVGGMPRRCLRVSTSCLRSTTTRSRGGLWARIRWMRRFRCTRRLRRGLGCPRRAFPWVSPAQSRPL